MKKGPISISKGTYDKRALTNLNSLYSNNLIYPEISKDILMLFPQYSLTNITAPFIESEADPVGDNKFTYPVMGRIEKGLTITGTVEGTGAGDNIVWLEVYEDYAQPTWEYKLGSDMLLRANDYGKKTVKGWMVPFKIMSGDNTDSVDSSDITDGRMLGPVANSNVEYSEKGYGAQQFPDWFSNYTTTTREAKAITGDAATSILWLEKNNTRMWLIGNSPEEWMDQFGKEDGGFLYKMEKDAWHGITTMDENGNCIKTDKDNKPIIRGNGLLQQIPQSMSYDYSRGTLSSKTFLNFIKHFKVHAGINGGKITLHTGAGGAALWYEVMARDFLHDGNRGIVYNMENGRKVTVGEDIPTYHVLGCDLTVFENPILTDPVLNPDVDEEGLSLMGYNFYFVDGNLSADRNGKMIPTIQKKVKKANGIDRSLVMKIIDGMVNPIEPDKLFSSNARDGYSVEFLSQWMIVLRKINGVGALIRTS